MKMEMLCVLFIFLVVTAIADDRADGPYSEFTPGKLCTDDCHQKGHVKGGFVEIVDDKNMCQCQGEATAQGRAAFEAKQQEKLKLARTVGKMLVDDPGNGILSRDANRVIVLDDHPGSLVTVDGKPKGSSDPVLPTHPGHPHVASTNVSVNPLCHEQDNQCSGEKGRLGGQFVRKVDKADEKDDKMNRCKGIDGPCIGKDDQLHGEDTEPFNYAKADPANKMAFEKNRQKIHEGVKKFLDFHDRPYHQNNRQMSPQSHQSPPSAHHVIAKVQLVDHNQGEDDRMTLPPNFRYNPPTSRIGYPAVADDGYHHADSGYPADIGSVYPSRNVFKVSNGFRQNPHGRGEYDKDNGYRAPNGVSAGGRLRNRYPNKIEFLAGHGEKIDNGIRQNDGYRKNNGIRKINVYRNGYPNKIGFQAGPGHEIDNGYRRANGFRKTNGYRNGYPNKIGFQAELDHDIANGNRNVNGFRQNNGYRGVHGYRADSEFAMHYFPNPPFQGVRQNGLLEPNWPLPPFAPHHSRWTSGSWEPAFEPYLENV